MGLIKAGRLLPVFLFPVFFFLVSGLYAQNPGELGAEIRNLEQRLTARGITAAVKYDTLTKLARLRQLSGDISGAAANWLDAAAVLPGESGDAALVSGAYCLAAIGEWERAVLAIRPLLASNRRGPLMSRARFLDACLKTWVSGNAAGGGDASALAALAGDPEFAGMKPTIYYTLWRTLAGDPQISGAGNAESWKTRLLAEFPSSPEARLLNPGSPSVSAVQRPLWLLAPETGPVLPESLRQQTASPAAPSQAAPPATPSQTAQPAPPQTVPAATPSQAVPPRAAPSATPSQTAPSVAPPATPSQTAQATPSQTAPAVTAPQPAPAPQAAPVSQAMPVASQIAPSPTPPSQPTPALRPVEYPSPQTAVQATPPAPPPATPAPQATPARQTVPAPQTIPAPQAAVSPAPARTAPPASGSATVLQTGVFGREDNARAMAERLQRAGFTPAISRKPVNGAEHWVVTVPGGPDPNKTAQDLARAGFDSFAVRY